MEIWKVAQETQRHFNDILLRIRNLAFLFAGSVLAGIAAIFKANNNERLIGIILLFALIPWIALYVLDRYYYHMLLVGSVIFAERIEQNHPDLAMARELTRVNRSSRFLFWSSGRAKISLFYGMPSITALVMGVYLLTANVCLMILVGIAASALILVPDAMSNHEHLT